MPAGLPGSTPVQNAANPSLGAAVSYDLLSGPKGSPFDNDKDYATGSGVANANASCGALATGIGFGQAMGPQGRVAANIPPNFVDDYTPGVSKPDATSSANSTYMYMGGGKCTKNIDGNAPVVPYTAGFGIGGGGNGGSRDAGAGPAFTGFVMKVVTAVADIAPAGVIETGFVNRSGVTLLTGSSQFGSSSTASAAVA